MFLVVRIGVQEEMEMRIKGKFPFLFLTKVRIRPKGFCSYVSILKKTDSQ